MATWDETQEMWKATYQDKQGNVHTRWFAERKTALAWWTRRRAYDETRG